MNNVLLKKTVEWSLCIIFAVIMALLIRYYIFTPSVVNQKSMEPTLEEGDRILINRTYRTKNRKYERGQIITFETPDNVNKLNNTDNIKAEYNRNKKGLFEKFVYDVLEINRKTYVKRIIGISGDKIQILDNGEIYVNETKVEEGYLESNTNYNNGYQSIIVPEGYVFVMGDNRKESLDSRRFGCIPTDKIDGIVKIRYWPFNKFGIIQ